MKIYLERQAKRDLKNVLSNNLMEKFLELTVAIVNNKNTPLQGIGKPEQLKYFDDTTYSRRLNDKDRIIYRYGEKHVSIIACIGHYDDK